MKRMASKPKVHWSTLLLPLVLDECGFAPEEYK